MLFGIDRNAVAKKVLASPGANVQTQSSPAATSEQARRDLAHLAYLLRTRSATSAGGPTEMYRVIGTFAQTAELLPLSLRRIGDVLADQDAQGRLVIESGPFVEDTPAAIAVVKQAMEDAAAACVDLHAALERAHLATAGVAAPIDPAGWQDRPRTSKSRLLTRRRR